MKKNNASKEHCSYTYNKVGDSSNILYFFSNKKKLPKTGGDIIDNYGSDKDNLMATSNIGKKYLHKIKLKHELKEVPVSLMQIITPGTSFYNKKEGTKYMRGDITEAKIKERIPYWLEKEEENYSGYELSHQSMKTRFINYADVISSDIVFSYLDEGLDKGMDNVIKHVTNHGYHELTDEEIEKIIAYVSWSPEKRDLRRSTKNLVQLFEMNPISLDTRYTLYRGLSWESMKKYKEYLKKCQQGYIEYDTISSWSTNLCVASYFAQQGYYGVVQKLIVEKSSVLLDTRLIDPDKWIDKIYREIQHEVILKPGKYECDIILLITIDGSGYATSTPDGTLIEIEFLT